MILGTLKIMSFKDQNDKILILHFSPCIYIYIWCPFLYVTGTWTLKKEDTRRINVFEMSTYWRMLLRFPGRPGDQISNGWQRKLSTDPIGHASRRKGYNLVKGDNLKKRIFFEKVPGLRRRGRAQSARRTLRRGYSCHNV